MEEEGLGLREVGPVVVWPCVPPWLLAKSEVDFSILERMKEEDSGSPDELVRARLQVYWAEHLQIYTDGSMDPASRRASFAMYIPRLRLTQGRRLSEGVSVFTSEVLAIIWALEWVEEVRPQQVVICSDSAAALMALQGGDHGSGLTSSQNY